MAAMVRSVDYDGESKGRENQGRKWFQLEAPDSEQVGTAGLLTGASAPVNSLGPWSTDCPLPLQLSSCKNPQTHPGTSCAPNV